MRKQQKFYPTGVYSKCLENNYGIYYETIILSWYIHFTIETESSSLILETLGGAMSFLMS